MTPSVEKAWQDYLNKLRRLEQAVKLTAFWTMETAKATRETALYAYLTALEVKTYLAKRKHRRE